LATFKNNLLLLFDPVTLSDHERQDEMMKFYWWIAVITLVWFDPEWTNLSQQHGGEKPASRWTAPPPL